MKDFIFQIFSLCDVFTPILTEDFHQLQIENSQFVKRIEEANQDVGKGEAVVRLRKLFKS